MAANITCYLRKGSKYINLNGSEFNLGPKFLPPGENIAFNVATGSSANETGGGEAISEARQDRILRFNIQVLGSSSQQIEASVRRLVSFLGQWNDPAEPLYFEYKGDTLPLPLWGQFGALRRYEVVHAEAQSVSNYYDTANTRSRYVEVVVELRLKPDALGNRQRLATASGGVVEDTYGMVDGTSRGLIVGSPATNLLTNPSFETNTTGWAASPGTIARSTDYALFGSYSLKVTQVAEGYVGYNFTAIALQDYAMSAYIYSEEGGQFTIFLSDNAAQGLESAAVTVPPGVWTRITNTGTTNATTARIYGIRAKQTCTYYIDGCSLVATFKIQPYLDGDMLGCAWTGTAHASTSTRTAGMVKIPMTEIIDPGGFTVVTVWKAGHTSLSETFRLWQTDTTLRRLSWETNVWTLEDGTNTITSAATSFTAGEVLVFHAVFSGSGMKLYKNGVEIATGNTYTIATTGSFLYVGTNSVVEQPSDGMFMMLSGYGLAMTPAQVAAQYAAIAPVVAADQRVDYIPWLWTKDGDDVVDNCDDSTRDNWAIVSGVAGNQKAKTEYVLTEAGTITYDLWMANKALDQFVLPSSQWFGDQSMDADATCCGGEYRSDNLASTGGDLSAFSKGPSYSKLMSGKVHVFARISDATGNLIAQPFVAYDASGYLTGDRKLLTSDASFRLYYIGAINVRPQLDGFYGTGRALFAGVYLTRSSGTGEIKCDYVMISDGDVMLLTNGASWENALVTQDGSFQINPTTGAQTAGDLQILGEYIEFYPNKYNHLLSLIGSDGGENVITNTLTYVRVNITPRYSLL